IETLCNDDWDERIDTVTRGFLGMTVACARCHDHKFDPIPTKDYYSLYGIFANTFEPKSVKDQPTIRPVPKTPELEAYLAKLAELDDKKVALENERIDLRRARNTDPQKRREL